MIRVTNLSHVYKEGQVPALHKINLEIKPGEYLTLIGPNGSGKTTLIRHFNALLIPQSGEVEVDGRSCRDIRNHVEIRRNVGMVFQNPDNQIVGMTVEEDVAFGPGNLNLPPAEIKSRVNRALDMVGLTGFEKRTPFSLSGGEKQLLALAGLLAVDPRYIVLDEATTSLDSAARGNVLAILERLRAQGVSIIQVTHNLDEAARADRVILMKAGEIVTAGPPGEILTDEELLRSIELEPPTLVQLMNRLMIPADARPGNILTLDQAAEFINNCLLRSETKDGSGQAQEG
jgi:biotin transport system ATP-binding protein